MHGRRAIRIMTWNIRTGVGNHPADEHARVPADLARVARIVRAVRPDVLTVQEIDRNRDRTGFVDQTEMLATEIGMEARFAPNLVDAAGEYGIATFSAYPIRESEHVRFPGSGSREPRGVFDVLIYIGEVSFRVLNTHLQVGEDDEARAQREDAANSLALRMQRSAEPCVLVGDVNADPSAPELASLAIATDAWIEGGDGGPGLTIPASPFRDPTHRIDVIYADRRFLVRDCAVIRTAETRLASDHYPVVADLVLAPVPDLSGRA